MENQGNYNSPLKATLQGIRDLYGSKKDLVSLPENMDMRGQKVLITGSSSGLGFATARRMAAAGAEVIMAVRSGIPEKGELLKKATGNEQIRMYHVDLADFESINLLLAKLESEEEQIDLIVSNAAMVALNSRLSPQGIEEMFMVNYLSAFYLINQIIQRGILRKSGEEFPKIIIISSESHRNSNDFEWDKFGKYIPYGINESVAKYGYYKLFLTTFANELSRRLSSAQIPVRILCPGPVNSNIAREAPLWMQPLLKVVFSIFFKSPDKASDPVLYFATQEKNDKAIEYLFMMQSKEMDAKALDKENGEKLWRMSEELLKELEIKGNRG